MAKTKKELKQLTEEELEQVTGGASEVEVKGNITPTPDQPAYEKGYLKIPINPQVTPIDQN